MSFHVDNWGEVLKAADIVTRHRVSHDIGPTRHGTTRGETDDDIGRATFRHDRAVSERFMSVCT